MRRFLILALLLLPIALRGEESGFRTDGGDEKLPWYQVQPGVFPPEGSGHYFAGELIKVNHLDRKFVVRVDRTDAQNRGNWDLPAGAQMLPYGAIYYQGAPAALQDIPLGTHLHGLYYIKDPSDKSPPLEGAYNRVSGEKDFTRCFLLEDDFSHYVRQGKVWRINEVNPDEKWLTATLMEKDREIESARKFDLLPSSRIWKGKGIASPTELSAGQFVQLNITWATLYGPGRLLDVWIDEESRQIAQAHQLQRHLEFVRLRGLAGWVDTVDNPQRIVTVTLFGGVDASLLADVKKGSSAGLCVAAESLMTYDPVNDRKSGPILEVNEVPGALGSSGVQLQIRPDLLLEGFRPQRIVRIYPSGWPVIALPREEQLFGQE